MKNTKSFLLLALFAGLLIFLQQQPLQTSAQPQPFGSNVVSDLLRFNVVSNTIGDNRIIAGKDGVKYRILYLLVKSQSSTSVGYILRSGSTFLYGNTSHYDTLDQDGTDGPAGIFFHPYDKGIFETTTGQDFTINLNGAQNIICVGAYVEVSG